LSFLEVTKVFFVQICGNVNVDDKSTALNPRRAKLSPYTTFTSLSTSQKRVKRDRPRKNQEKVNENSSNFACTSVQGNGEM